MRVLWMALFVGVGLGLASSGSGCGDECNTASDCNFGEACVFKTCVNNDTAQTCGRDADCNSNPANDQNVLVCVAGQCQLPLDRPPLPPPQDAGTSTAADGGP